MIPYVTVRGTWGDGKLYNQFDVPGTAWTEYMKARELYHIGGHRPFRWTTDLERNDRAVAGANLYAYIVPPLAPQFAVPPTETHVITYSFGLDVALHAAAQGLRIQTLITIGGPVRRDMMSIAEEARRNIYQWICVHSRDDWTQQFGTWFDREWNPFRPTPVHPLADSGIELPRAAGHGGAFYEEKWFDLVWGRICIPAIRRNHQAVLRRVPLEGPALRLLHNEFFQPTYLREAYRHDDRNVLVNTVRAIEEGRR